MSETSNFSSWSRRNCRVEDSVEDHVGKVGVYVERKR